MASTRKLTLRQILALREAHVAFDGHVEILFDEKGKPQKGKVTPFALGPKARYAFIKNIPILNRFHDDFQKVRDAAILETSGGSGVIKDTDPDYAKKMGQVNAELNKILDVEEEVIGLATLPYDDLKLETNILITHSMVVALGDVVVYPAEESIAPAAAKAA